MNATLPETVVRFPPKLEPLFRPSRFKVLWGGRDAGRSWGVARALLTLGASRPLRILCAREVQRTLADSVHKLLCDQVERMGLSDFYSDQESGVYGRNGTEFFYAGLRDLDVSKIKSYEGVDIVWVEEAETLTKRSFNILEPTIRKDGSELWFTLNVQMDSDFVYQHLIQDQPAGAVVIYMTWQDNPWHSAVLDAGRERMRLNDHDEYENIWEGRPRTVMPGAIYAKEMRAMLEGRRVRPMPYDPALPVHTIWDLGWNDSMSIIMAQRLHSVVTVVDYLEDQFKTYAQCVAELNRRSYVWGTDWLPPDGNQTHPETGKSAKATLEKLGRRSVRVIGTQGTGTKALPVEDGIRAARMMFPRLYIDNTDREEEELQRPESERWRYSGPARLVECLKRYRRAVPTTTGEPSHPVHDEFSHGCDAVRGMATIVDKMENEAEAPPPRFASYGVLDPVAGL